MNLPTPVPFPRPSSVSLADYGHVLRRHIWTIAATTAIIVGAVVWYTRQETPTYSSTAKVLVQRSTVSSASGSATTPTEADMATEAQLVASEPIAASVRTALALNDPTDTLVDHLTVEQIVSSGFLAVTYTDPDPRRAADLANAFSRSYISIRDSDTVLPGRAQLIEPAVPPTSPQAPAVVRNVALALAAGLVLGVLLAFVKDGLQGRAASDDDVAAALDAPVLARIPRLRRPNQALHQALHLMSGPTSPAYGFLAARLQLIAPSDRAFVVLMTDALGDERKTNVTANTALALGKAGHRIVVVSADVRSPRLHSSFSLTNDDGLFDVLEASPGERDQVVEKALRPTAVPQVRVLTSRPHPDGLPLDIARWRGVLDSLRRAGDMILLDGPSMLTVADGAVLAACADAVVLVVPPGRSEKRVVLTQAATTVRAVGGILAGSVRNGVGLSRGRGYFGAHDRYTEEAKEDVAGSEAGAVL